MKTRITGVTLATLAALAGCSGGSDPVLCIPGTTNSCQCVGLKVGVQVCRTDGSGYEACQCDAEDSGPQRPDYGPAPDFGRPGDEDVGSGEDTGGPDAGDPGSCRPTCGERKCGDDGCGGSCGSCDLGLSCQDGACVDVCKGVCAGRECGPDDCGGACGTCPAERKICNSSFQCVAQCAPDCEGKDCGDDGCGGQCGKPCAQGYHCESGACLPGCKPSCGNRQCGDDGCGGSCGTCAGGVVCTAQGQCGSGCETCVANPACVNLGFESGNLAGWAVEGDAKVVSAFGPVTPPQGQYMLQLSSLTTPAGQAGFGTCVPAGTRSVTFRWRLASEEFKEYCASSYQDAFEVLIATGGTPTTIFRRTIDHLCDPANCNGVAACGAAFVGLEKSPVALDQQDAWITPWMDGKAGLGLGGSSATPLTILFRMRNAGDAIYETRVLIDDVKFSTACAPECLGKGCGNDGCGGSCGTCGNGLACDAGKCIDECKASCSGKVCGPDACDGSCGTCPDGCTCRTDGTGCLNAEGGVCGSVPQPTCSTCKTDADCTGLEGGTGLKCTSGKCHDPSGSCATPACCATGQECFDPIGLVLGGGMPLGGGAVTCSCDAQHPCLGGGTCYDSQGICTGILGMLICPSGLPEGYPPGMCSDPATFLGGFPL